jgi:hypothetical protein
MFSNPALENIGIAVLRFLRQGVVKNLMAGLFKGSGIMPHGGIKQG